MAEKYTFKLFNSLLGHISKLPFILKINTVAVVDQIDQIRSDYIEIFLSKKSCSCVLCDAIR